MGSIKANFIAVLCSILLFYLLTIPVKFIWGSDNINEGKELFLQYFLLIFAVGLIVHELLHGITWALLMRKKLNVIKFGIKGILLFCHCKVPISVKHYRLGIIMPFFVMGIIPWFISLLTGSGLILYIGVLYSISASADIIGLFMLRDLESITLVSDHPNKMGFTINKPI